MRMKTLATLIKERNSKDIPLIPKFFNTPDFNFLDVYFANYRAFDTTISSKQGSRMLLFDDDETNDSLLLAVPYMNKYKWSKLHDTLLLEYNPIENYDRQEKSTRKPDLTTVRHYNGSEKTTYSGAETNTQTGSTDRVKSGGETTTEKPGVIRTHERNSYNPAEPTLEYRDSDSGTNISDTTYKNLTVTEKYNAIQHKKDFVGRNDLKEYQNREDTETVQGQDVTESRIHGNIGVTTSQQMIQSEREVASFNYILTVLNDVVNDICSMLYEGVE